MEKQQPENKATPTTHYAIQTSLICHLKGSQFYGEWTLQKTSRCYIHTGGSVHAPYIAHKMQLMLFSGTHFSICSERLAVRAVATAMTTSADISAKLSNC